MTSHLQKRHRADDETNNREVRVLRDGNWQIVKWTQVVVGDIVKVVNSTFFPADLVLLSSRYWPPPAQYSAQYRCHVRIAAIVACTRTLYMLVFVTEHVVYTCKLTVEC